MTSPSSPPPNKAAYLPGAPSHPLTISPAPYTPPSPNELVIKTASIGIAIVDWARQFLGHVMFPDTVYPTIIGCDVSGTVVEVGPMTSSTSSSPYFKPGDRVLGLARAFSTHRNTDGSFQEYVVLSSTLVSKIPEHISFEQGATLPLAICTAATGLFQKDLLGLRLPTVPKQPASGETVLIWSGSSSVGCSAIQLAVAAGYSVITTASPHNFALVKSLGASMVFDHYSPTIVSEIIAAFGGLKSVGVLAIDVTAPEICCEIVKQIEGRGFVAMANLGLKEMPEGVEGRFYLGNEGCGEEIFGKYLPEALASGDFRPAPEPEVVGRGLEALQGTLDKVVKSVSAKKLVVCL